MRLYDELGLSRRAAGWFEAIAARLDPITSLNDPRHIYALCELCGHGRPR